jgi:O-6-methylguanine DNA methyltransferase
MIHTAKFDSPIGELTVASSETGLAYVALPFAAGRGLHGWQQRHAREESIVEGYAANRAPIQQILEFLEGKRDRFELELDLRATPFQLDVYRAVEAIGYGEKRSYAEVAERVGRPKAVRAVGAANGANPIPLIVPCHRVVASSGQLQGYAGGLDLKAKLLAMEHTSHPGQGQLF